jgi:hypothetical protein
MDIKQFMATVQPGKKISRLKQFEKDIRELKANGYTDDQIRIWLAENNLIVSREAVRQFVKKFGKGEVIPTLEQDTKMVEKPTEHQDESNAERLRKRLAKQKEKADGTRFKHDKSGNN